MGFSKQEYWSGLPFPSPEDLPEPGIEPASPALEGGFFTTEPAGEPREIVGPCKRMLYSPFHFFLYYFLFSLTLSLPSVFPPSFCLSPPAIPPSLAFNKLLSTYYVQGASVMAQMVKNM